MFMNQIDNTFRRPLPQIVQPEVQFLQPGPNAALMAPSKQQQQGGGMMDAIMKLFAGGGQGGQGSGGMDLAQLAAMFAGG